MSEKHTAGGDESRKQFEAYMRSRNVCVRLHRQRAELGGFYRTTTVQRAWELWRAARRQNEQATEVLREFSALYGNLWDMVKPAGSGFLSAESVAKYDAIHARAHDVLLALATNPDQSA